MKPLKKAILFFEPYSYKVKNGEKLGQTQSQSQPFLVETRMFYLTGLNTTICCDTDLVINSCF